MAEGLRGGGSKGNLGMVVVQVSAARAEDLNAILKRMNDYVAQENYPKALEELSWACKAIEKMHAVRIAKLLPATVEGFTADPPKLQSAMGFSQIECKYKKGGQKITLSIAGTGGSG